MATDETVHGWHDVTPAAVPVGADADIWDMCQGANHVTSLRCTALRAVEAQHIVSTRKLVDSDEEQACLEQMLESAKPARTGDASAGLHYLLATPFRYPPLPWGSRFGTRAQPGLWYGATRARTALAEVAFYRLLLIEGSEADLTPLMSHLSLIAAKVATPRGVHLTRPPFAAFADQLTSKLRYGDTQALGAAMREAGVEAFTYWSARDPGGTNIGVFTPQAFATPHLLGPPQTWSCVVDDDKVEFTCTDLVTRQRLRFERAALLVDGKLVLPS